MLMGLQFLLFKLKSMEFFSKVVFVRVLTIFILAITVTDIYFIGSKNIADSYAFMALALFISLVVDERKNIPIKIIILNILTLVLLKLVGVVQPIHTLIVVWLFIPICINKAFSFLPIFLFTYISVLEVAPFLNDLQLQIPYITNNYFIVDFFNTNISMITLLTFLGWSEWCFSGLKEKDIEFSTIALFIIMFQSVCKMDSSNFIPIFAFILLVTFLRNLNKPNSIFLTTLFLLVPLTSLASGISILLVGSLYALSRIELVERISVPRTVFRNLVPLLTIATLYIVFYYNLSKFYVLPAVFWLIYVSKVYVKGQKEMLNVA